MSMTHLRAAALLAACLAASPAFARHAPIPPGTPEADARPGPGGPHGPGLPFLRGIALTEEQRASLREERMARGPR